MKMVVFCLFIFLGGSGSVWGQEMEFAPIGAKWHYHFCDVISNCGVEIFEVSKDTTINDRNCRVINRKLITASGETLYPDAYLCLEGKQVYHFVSDTFYLLYDFSAEVGDTWETQLLTRNYTEIADEGVSGERRFGKVTVDSLEMIEINGELLKKQYFSFETEGVDESFVSVDFSWAIEKLGGNYMFIQFASEAQAFKILNCYSDNQLSYKNPMVTFNCDQVTNVQEYTNKDDIILYPNPTVNKTFKLLNTKNIHQIEIYSVDGRKVYQINKKDINANSVQIEISQLGLYVVKVFLEDGHFYSKNLFVR